MKTYSLAALILILASNAIGQSLPNKTSIVNTLKKVNDYWIGISPETNTDRFDSVSWKRAVYFTGHMEFYKLYRQQSYFDYAMFWASNNQWGLGQTRRGVTSDPDNQCVGQPYLDLYALNGSNDSYMIANVISAVDDMVASSAVDNWWWIDGLFMAMPVFTRLGVIENDGAYHDKAYSLYNDTKTRRALYDTNAKLWFRDEKYKPPYKTPNGKKCFWSRGNGWVFAALVRTLKYLPDSNPHRSQYLQTFKDMAAALLAVQRSDGFWNVSLADPNQFPGPETSGTSAFLYGMAWGVNNGHLNAATYRPAINKAWNGIVTQAIHNDGKLGYVQGPADRPSGANFDQTSDYGVGLFLLAGTEVLKLADGILPAPSRFTIQSVDDEQARNFASNMLDGNKSDDSAKWSARYYPKSVVFDAGSPVTFTGTKMWTYQNRAYRYTIETSDFKDSGFVLRADQRGNTSTTLPLATAFTATGRYVKLTITGPIGSYNDWISINEFEVLFR